MTIQNKIINCTASCHLNNSYFNHRRKSFSQLSSIFRMTICNKIIHRIASHSMIRDEESIESSLEQNIEKWYRARLVCTISKQEDSRPHVNFAVCSPSSSSATKYSRVMLYTSRGQK